jgi:peptide-methionine (R)-S-oxide reductase
MRVITYLLLTTIVCGACLLVLGWASPPGQVRAEDKSQDQLQSKAAKENGMEAEQSVTEDQKKPAKVVKSENEWRRLLTREQYRVLRMKGTERPFTNRFDRHFVAGTYSCAACGQELFASDTKFNSGCGWPAFYAAKAGDRVVLTPDYTHGMVRTEVTCARCDSHLGHVFEDAPQTPTGQRFCINSVSLKFTPSKAKPEAKASAEEPATESTAADPKQESP